MVSLRRQRRVKIVATLGPASDSQEMIRRLFLAGADVFRLNMSHGSQPEIAERHRRIRAVEAEVGRPIGILADLQGPKLRLGIFERGAETLEAGGRFRLDLDETPGDASRVGLPHPEIFGSLTPGATLLVNDGKIRLRVERCGPEAADTVVEVGGEVSNRKGVNFPDVVLPVAALSAKDRSDLEFVCALGVDWLALSFVQRAEDIEEARALIDRRAAIIAKIEKPAAVEAFAAILAAADGIMVARGDLGVELGSEKVPLVQKRIILSANRAGKIVITATQMLDSMMRNPRPTRAEAADVANAVMDGTDAVMLSGETAAGKYPVEAVRMMDAIVREVEAESVEGLSRQIRDVKIIANEDWRAIGATARAAAVLATHLHMRAIVSFTNDGLSTRLLAEHRPRVPIVSLTRHPQVASQLALIWGVVPRVEVPPESLEEIRRTASALLSRERICGPGDTYALLFPWPLSGRTNTLSLHTL
jgi:pyruvate kinase